jgi:hypothetical protein
MNVAYFLKLLPLFTLVYSLSLYSVDNPRGGEEGYGYGVAGEEAAQASTLESSIQSADQPSSMQEDQEQ